MKRLLTFLMVFVIAFSLLPGILVHGEENENTKENTKENKTETSGVAIESASGILMEASTGQVIYEMNATKELKPASVTKVMTLLLIFEALDQGKINLTDKVTVSSHAASMGGSQVFLESGEVQTVDTMLKAIAMASGNDACVAMAEHIAGSEEAFVQEMNKKAQTLGMKNTNFVNACGLDADNHYTSALDIALMSRELTVKHPDVFRYTTVWMDEFTHVTKKGESVFGLANTNKLLKQYNGATGLKTGSTSLAKFCLSATATRNDIDLIAVVMAAPDPKTRFKDAAKLLDYGFANCDIYIDNDPGKDIKNAPVKRGVSDTIDVDIAKEFKFVCVNNQKKENIKKEVKFNGNMTAPIKKGDVMGNIEYTLDNNLVGSVDIKAAKDMGKMTFKISFIKILESFVTR